MFFGTSRSSRPCLRLVCVWHQYGLANPSPCFLCIDLAEGSVQWHHLNTNFCGAEELSGSKTRGSSGASASSASLFGYKTRQYIFVKLRSRDCATRPACPAPARPAAVAADHFPPSARARNAGLSADATLPPGADTINARKLEHLKALPNLSFRQVQPESNWGNHHEYLRNVDPTSVPPPSRGSARPSSTQAGRRSSRPVRTTTILC